MTGDRNDGDSKSALLIFPRSAIELTTCFQCTYKSTVPFLLFMYRDYSEKPPGALRGVQQEKEKRKKAIRIKKI